MKPTVIAAAIFTALIGLVSAAGLNTARIDQLTGLKGKLNEKEGVYNVPNARQVAVIDREKREVITRWNTDLAFGNFPMALDEADHRLFIGCRLPPKLVVIDTDAGDVVAKIDISGDCDNVFYDGKRHRAYAICGAGKIDIIDQTDPNTYTASTKVDTADGARTGLFVSERDTSFVAVPHHGSQKAEIRAYRIE